MAESKCSICRRAGEKLFLRGERCFSQKCALVKRNTPPGRQKKRRGGGASEYSRELREKQKLKFWYGLREKQFRKYVKMTLAKRKILKDINLFLVSKLESRLDNVIFKLGLASSRTQARKLITQKHFLVNNRNCDIPSLEIKKGDMVSVKQNSFKKKIFQNLILTIKKYQPPAWLELDKEKLEGKILREPTMEEINIPVEIPMILEFYSK